MLYLGDVVWRGASAVGGDEVGPIGSWAWLTDGAFVPRVPDRSTRIRWPLLDLGTTQRPGDPHCDNGQPLKTMGRVIRTFPALRQDEQKAKPFYTDLSKPLGGGRKCW